jgi:hypothetical protein
MQGNTREEEEKLGAPKQKVPPKAANRKEFREYWIAKFIESGCVDSTK